MKQPLGLQNILGVMLGMYVTEQTVMAIRLTISIRKVYAVQKISMRKTPEDITEHNDEVGLKAEREIMRLHEKMDSMREEHEKQWRELLTIQQEQLRLLGNLIEKNSRHNNSTHGVTGDLPGDLVRDDPDIAPM